MCGGSLHAMETKNDIASEQVFIFKHTSFIKAKIYFCSLHFWLIIILVPTFFLFFLPDSVPEIKKAFSF